MVRSAASRDPHSSRHAAAEKGGDLELVKASQRRRFAEEGLVDRVAELDGQWRQGA